LRRTRPLSWIILSYDVPDEPSRIRVRLWRQLKSMGALYPPSSFCILPDAEDVRSRLDKLSSTIKPLGPITMFEARTLDNRSLGIVYSLFKEEFDREYRELEEECEEFLEEIRKNVVTKNVTSTEVSELEELLEGLERWLEKIKKKDFVGSEERAKTEKLLARCRKSLLAFSVKALPERIRDK
jgi:hypothetical protein